MPRQLNEVIKVKPSQVRQPRFASTYEDSQVGLTKYLKDKYGLDIFTTANIVRDIFRFIDSAVMRGKKGQLRIRRFGNFRRTSYRGKDRSFTVMKLDRSVVTRNGTVYTLEPDPEWIDEDD